MLTAYLFDKQRGERVEEWQATARTLRATQLLWVDLSEPTSEDAREVAEAFGLGGVDADRLSEDDCQAGLEQGETYIRVTAIAGLASDDGRATPSRTSSPPQQLEHALGVGLSSISRDPDDAE
jgi:Mg2+ and Co2+ transporter CorA